MMKFTPLALGESIAILGMFLVVMAAMTLCAAVLVRVAYLLFKHGKLSRGLRMLALVAALPPLGLVTLIWTQDQVEQNPTIQSTNQLYGVYVKGSAVLRLNRDGTYSASGLKGIISGKWSHDDWNLTLTNTDLADPRIMMLNGVFCVAPYYDSMREYEGVLLMKREESPVQQN